MPAIVDRNHWSIQLPLDWGSNLLQIVALDRAGNVGMAPPTSLQAEPGMGATLTIEPTTGRVGEQVTVTALVTATVGMTATLSFP